MSENKKLRIYTQLPPAAPAPRENVRWRCVPHPLNQKRRMRSDGKKLSAGDRLLRNSALSCALLLAVLAMGNINRPWARQASETIEQALTMHIDLDESIGQLSFVRELMPESALVFLNLSPETVLQVPVDGELSHSYTEAQPWLLFDCTAGSPVVAADDGIVTAVSELSGGTYGILIDHGNGVESVYAYLAGAEVEAGVAVEKGQRIGISESTLYFELHNAETTLNPTEKMGL